MLPFFIGIIEEFFSSQLSDNMIFLTIPSLILYVIK